LVLIAFAVAVYWVSHHPRRERRLDDLLSPDPLKDQRADGLERSLRGATANVARAARRECPISIASPVI